MAESVARVFVLAATLLLLSCSSGGTGPDSADAFVGSWTFDSGSISPMCAVSLPAIELTGGNMTIGKIDSTHISAIVVANGIMCIGQFVINGTTEGIGGSVSTATGKNEQTCTATDEDMSLTVSVTSWVLTLSSSKISTIGMSISMQGTVGTSMTSCSPTAAGTLSHASFDAGIVQ
jgi:hypothetical protein